MPSLVQIKTCRLFSHNHYQNQWYFIVKWNLRNIFQWKFILNSTVSFKKMHLYMSSAKMAAILSRPQCVNPIITGSYLHICIHGTFYSNRPMASISQYTSPISQNAPFVTEMCTFLLQNGALWDICLIHCGISSIGLCSLDTAQHNASAYHTVYM